MVSTNWGNAQQIDTYLTLAEMVSSLGSGNETIIIDEANIVSADLTIPSNISLLFMQSGSISVNSGVTLTINGDIIAGRFQIFSGSGTIAGLTRAYPEWWGTNTTPGTTDMTTAIQTAINALTGTYAKLLFANDTYLIDGSLDFKGGVSIIGDATTLSFNDSATQILYRPETIFDGFKLSMPSAYTGTAVLLDGADTYGTETSRRTVLRNIHWLHPSNDAGSVALKFLVEAASEHITWVYGENLQFSGWETGMFFSNTLASGSAWINGNTFHRVMAHNATDGSGIVNFIYSNRDTSNSSAEINQNSFVTLQLQGSANLVKAIRWHGRYNHFYDIQFFDLASIAVNNTMDVIENFNTLQGFWNYDTNIETAAMRAADLILINPQNHTEAGTSYPNRMQIGDIIHLDRIYQKTTQTLNPDDNTPQVQGGNIFTTANTVTTTYTNFDNGKTNQQILIKVNDSNTRFSFSGTNLKCNHRNLTPVYYAVSGDLVRATYDGTNWYCELLNNTIFGSETLASGTKAVTFNHKTLINTTYSIILSPSSDSSNSKMRDQKGSTTLVGGTKAIAFSTNFPDANYKITLSGDANETFYWASKATTGFTINSSNGASTANVDWKAEYNDERVYWQSKATTGFTIVSTDKASDSTVDWVVIY